MNGPEHYREAERLLSTIGAQVAHAEANGLRESTLTASITACIAQAQVHATLALVAVQAETGVFAGTRPDDGRPLVGRPLPGDGIDPPYPGNPWGRALYGDLPTGGAR